LASIKSLETGKIASEELGFVNGAFNKTRNFAAFALSKSEWFDPNHIQGISDNYSKFMNMSPTDFQKQIARL